METAKGKAQEENLGSRIDTFEKYTYPHARLLAELATRLARRFGLTPQDTHAVSEAALLHDIGLLALMPAYHSRPGLLNYEERMDLWRHAVIGEQQMAKREATRHAQLLVRWHHEWWCGLGYPDMLAFEDIPIGARLLRAVELYCALIGDRPYRAAMGAEQALETLKASAGIECDPYVVKALVALLEDLRAQAASSISTTAPTVDPATVAQALETFTEPPSVEPASVEPALDMPPGDESTASDRPLMNSEPEAAAAEQTNEAAAVAPDELHADEITLPDVSSEATAPPVALNDEPPTDAPTQPDASDKTAAERSPVEWLMTGGRWREFKDEQAAKWDGWRSSSYNRKSLLGFEASVLRQVEFRSVAIPFFGWTRLDLYLKTWGKTILANDPRLWAATVARAMLESPSALGEDQITRLLEDVYVPGVRLANLELRRWFSESDAWWMDNLRRNIESLEDESCRAQAMTTGLMTGDYARSFTDETRELRRPLTTVFWR
ncbi:MAG TPA: HD domain-containing phosphohydrolase, partial [Blastocatellia bacterium]